MAEKEMFQVKVSLSKERHIVIEQGLFDGDHESISTITIHPDQVNLFIKWIKEAKEKSLQNKN